MSDTAMTNAFLEFADIISGNSAQKTLGAITIKGEIVDIVDPAQHRYKVSYGGTVYDNVYAQGDVTYSPSTVVYILVPNGNDFSQNKFILGAYNASATQYVTETASDMYVPISNNVFSLSEDFIYNMKSWKDQNEKIPAFNNPNAKGVLNDYFQEYRTFLFSAEVKTEIPTDHRSSGNYGLILTIPLVKKGENGDLDKTLQTFVIDVNTMQGNPYNYGAYSKNDFYYTLPDGWDYDPSVENQPSLVGFVSGFNYLDTSSYGEDDYDIHFKKIQMRFLDAATTSSVAGYKLTIVPSEGPYFLDGLYNTNKILSLNLKVNGKDTSIKDWECYWYVEDSSVNINSNDYTRFGGLGWRCLNKKNYHIDNGQGDKGYTYENKKYTYEIICDNNIGSLRYKCIIVKDETIVSATIKITNLDSKVETQLVSKTGNSEYLENIGKVHLVARVYDPIITLDNSNSELISLVWQRYDSSGNIIDKFPYTIEQANKAVRDSKDKQWFETEISFPSSIVEKSNLIKCSFYRNSLSSDTCYAWKYNYVDDNNNPQEQIYYTKVENPPQGASVYMNSSMTEEYCKVDEIGNNYIKILDELICTRDIEGDIKKYESKILGTEQINITTTKEPTYTLTIRNGDIVYKYDGDGDSPFVADYDGPISSRMENIQPLSYNVYKPDGSELTESEYLYTHFIWKIPKNSMIVLDSKYRSSEMYDADSDPNYYIIQGYQSTPLDISYTIKDVYNKKNSDNTIILTVELDDNVVSAATNINFIKDGEGGTNGSKYTALIEYDGRPYGQKDPADGRVKPLQLVYIAEEDDKGHSAGWYVYVHENISSSLVKLGTGQGEVSPVLTCKIYKDGELYAITENDKVEWDTFDTSLADPCVKIHSDTGVISIRDGKIWSDSNANYCSIIQCKVTIGKNADETINEEILYAYYPIELTRIDKAERLTWSHYDVIPHLEGGYETVLYGSDGQNPQYDNTNDFKCVNNIYNDDEGDLYDYVWDASTNLKFNSSAIDPGPEMKFTPVNKFLNGDTKNYVRVELKSSASQQTYKTEQQQFAYDQWQTNKDLLEYYGKWLKDATEPTGIWKSLRNFIVNFNTNITSIYDILKNQKTQNILSYKNSLLSSITDLNTALNEFYDYCKNKSINVSHLNYIKIQDEYKKKLDSTKQDIYLCGSGLTQPKQITLTTIVKNDNLATKYKLTTEVSKVEKTLKKEYGISVTDQIMSYAINWDEKLKKYNESFQELVKKNNNDFVCQSEWTSLQSISNTLNSLITSVKGINTNLTLSSADKDSWWYIERDNQGNKTGYRRVTNVDFTKEYVNIYTDSRHQDQFEEGNIYCVKRNNGDYYQIVKIKPSETYYKITEVPIDVGIRNEIIGLQNQFETIAKRMNDSEAGVNSYNDYINLIYQALVDLVEKYNDSGYQKTYFEDNQKKFEDNIIKFETEYNSFKGSIKVPASETALIHIKPIVMILNRYGHGNLNAWDGNKIYIDETNNQYILAPQMGAGIKETVDGITGFTGLVMGIEDFRVDETKKKKIGLFGLKLGVQSLFLNAEDGSAIFGKPGCGQLIIDPTSDKSLIYSDNYWKSYKDDGKPASYGSGNKANKGMLINLTDSTIHFGSSESGKLYSGGHDKISSSEDGFWLSQNGLSIGSKVYIDNTGTMRLGINAVSNSNDCWTINGNDDGKSYIGFKTDKIKFNFSNNTISGSDGEVYIGTDGIRLGSKFAVNNNGDVSANNIKIKGTAEIGDWELSGGEIVGGNIRLKASGKIYHSGDNWSIENDGTATFKRVTITGNDSSAGSNTDTTIGAIQVYGNKSAGGIQSAGFVSGINGSGFRIASTGSAEFNTLTVNGNGSIGGCSITNGVLKVPSANITGKLTANQIDANIITTDNMSGLSFSCLALTVGGDLCEWKKLNTESGTIWYLGKAGIT